MQMLARRGLYSIVGYGGIVTHPSVGFVVGETVVAGNLVGNWIDLWELLQLHVRGEITLRTETHPLEDVNDVLDTLARRRGHRPGRPRPMTERRACRSGCSTFAARVRSSPARRAGSATRSPRCSRTAERA